MSQPLVSILVPSYNHGRYLTERVESIFGQTFQNFELVIIDDCSKDDSDDVLRTLQEKFNFQYIRNDKNSGTPFAAWECICNLARGEYIWICESDDVAEPLFLETAIRYLKNSPSSVAFYSNSWIIDEGSQIVGHTESHFRDIWKEERWERDFSANGTDELINFQLRGQVVPNMSSALFVADAFRKAFDPFVKRLRLTGDWLFVGEMLRYGDVEFCHEPLNRFRKHEETSRVRVRSARSQAEFVLTKYRLFRRAKMPVVAFASLMSSDVLRFLYEHAAWWDVVKEALQISPRDTFRCALLLLASTIKNPMYLEKFKIGCKRASVWKKENV